jgi:hypothetical protein
MSPKFDPRNILANNAEWHNIIILKIFLPKNLAKKNYSILTEISVSLDNELIITFVFEKNVDVFPESWRKSAKTVITTLALHQ